MSDTAGRLRRLFEAAPDGIVCTSAQAIINESNAAFRRLVGRAAEELHGLTVADLSLPDEYAREQQLLRDLIRRRALEQALRRQQEELELSVRARTADLHRVNRELESFTVAMAHDLRTPLRALSGYVRLHVRSGAG